MYIYTWVKCKFFFHPHPKPASCHFGRPIKANMFGSHLHPFKEFLCILWPTLVLEDERRWHEGGTTHQRPKRINMKPEGHTPSPWWNPWKKSMPSSWTPSSLDQTLEYSTYSTRNPGSWSVPNHLVDLDKAFGFCISSAASNTGPREKQILQILQGLNHLLLPHGLSLQVGVFRKIWHGCHMSTAITTAKIPKGRWPTSEGNKNIFFLHKTSTFVLSNGDAAPTPFCHTVLLVLATACYSKGMWAKGLCPKGTATKQRRHLSLSQFLAITFRSKPQDMSTLWHHLYIYKSLTVDIVYNTTYLIVQKHCKK